jgi:hypothetical protein
MNHPSLLSRLARADTRYRDALQRLLVWGNADESRAASLLFLEGYTEQARRVLPPELYAIFRDAAEADAELRQIEEALRRLQEEAPLSSC